jgi:hypothetical protein
MLEGLINKLKTLSLIDENQLMHDVLENATLQTQIIDLNQHQLYDEGIQADGTETGQYALKTIQYKQAYGDSRRTPGNISHITGNDTGKTYDSMKVKNMQDSFEITAEDRNDFFAREPEGLGLTEKSIEEIQPAIIDGMIEKIKELL